MEVDGVNGDVGLEVVVGLVVLWDEVFWIYPGPYGEVARVEVCVVKVVLPPRIGLYHGNGSVGLFGNAEYLSVPEYLVFYRHVPYESAVVRYVE